MLGVSSSSALSLDVGSVWRLTDLCRPAVRRCHCRDSPQSPVSCHCHSCLTDVLAGPLRSEQLGHVPPSGGAGYVPFTPFLSYVFYIGFCPAVLCCILYLVIFTCVPNLFSTVFFVLPIYQSNVFCGIFFGRFHINYRVCLFLVQQTQGFTYMHTIAHSLEFFIPYH